MEIEDIIMCGIIGIFLIAIIILSIISLIDYNKSLELDIINTGVECTYNNLKEANKCIIDDQEFCSQPSKFNYILSQIPKSYIQVCKDICSLKEGSKECIDKNLQTRFDQCVQDLSPKRNCLDPERPLALDNEGNYLYANSISS